ncbi:murein hydrolase activator EnvC family protein [Thermodesulfobacteriota bacterium]
MKKSQMRQIENDLSREKEQFLKYDLKEKSILDHLSSVEKDITEKRVVLKELTKKIRLNRRELTVRRERLNRLKNSLIEMEDLLSQRIVAFYKYAKRGYLQILATTSGLDQLNHRIKYLKVILNEDRKAMKQMADEQLKYREEVSLIEEQLAIIAGLEKSESNRLSSLKRDLEKKVILLAKIHKEKEFYETAVKELQSAARNLKETLLNLDRDQYKKKPLPSGFAESKGKLPLPLKGKVIKGSKKLGEKNFDTHKGIYIGSPFGSEVKAIFPGRVDFSGQLKGYGQVIVINHGSRFYTISAYMFQRDKAEGGMVAKGEVIGQVGETGLLTGPALYFEIREGETSLDPLKWLKVN